MIVNLRTEAAVDTPIETLEVAEFALAPELQIDNAVYILSGANLATLFDISTTSVLPHFIRHFSVSGVCLRKGSALFHCRLPLLLSPTILEVQMNVNGAIETIARWPRATILGSLMGICCYGPYPDSAPIRRGCLSPHPHPLAGPGGRLDPDVPLRAGGRLRPPARPRMPMASSLSPTRTFPAVPPPA